MWPPGTQNQGEEGRRDTTQMSSTMFATWSVAVVVEQSADDGTSIRRLGIQH